MFSPTEIKFIKAEGEGEEEEEEGREKIARYASRVASSRYVSSASRVASRKWRHFGRCGTAEPGSEPRTTGRRDKETSIAGVDLASESLVVAREHRTTALSLCEALRNTNEPGHRRCTLALSIIT